ncbi:MAG: hypothetical protein JNL50_07295 [Phycisphaerae bacterium]|nr:hypothetical protein [Phycisphaerae bacterium]
MLLSVSLAPAILWCGGPCGTARAQTRVYSESAPATRPGPDARPADPDGFPSRVGRYAPRLLPGSKAPALPELIPIRGEAPASLATDTPTLVEFWVSWCPNCRDRAFAVGELERLHPGKVREIVIVSPDRFGSSEEGARELAKVATAADTMGAIAWDSKAEARSRWLSPARRSTVPSAFLVDPSGVIVWIGHPADAADALARVLAGEWDVDDAARDYARRFRDQAWRDDASLRFDAAGKAGNWDELLRALDDLDLYQPAVAGSVAANAIPRMLLDQRARALELAIITEKAVWDENHNVLNDMAWSLLNAGDPTEDEIAAARRMAERASERTAREDGMIEDTLALALYRDGERELAIKTQEHAIELLSLSPGPRNETLRQFQDRLKMYQESAPIDTRLRKRARERGQGSPQVQ